MTDDRTPWARRSGTKQIRKWTKINGTITAIRICRWWKVAEAVRLLRSGFRFYGPNDWSLIFVEVDGEMPIHDIHGNRIA